VAYCHEHLELEPRLNMFAQSHNIIVLFHLLPL
jgi:hypothetical protein